MGASLICKLTLSVVAVRSKCIIHRMWDLSSGELVEWEQRSALIAGAQSRNTQAMVI